MTKTVKVTAHKNKDGSYTAFIFNGGIQAVKSITRRYKKDALVAANIEIDYNEYNFLGV